MERVVKMKDYDEWEYNNSNETIDILKNGKVIEQLYIDSIVENWAEE